MNSSKKCRCVRTASEKRTPWTTICSLWVMLITRKVKVLAQKVAFIQKEHEGHFLEDVDWPTDVPASTFCLVKMVEDEDYVAPVI